MLFSFKDSIPRQDYDTPPAVVSGRKILIPLRLPWRGEMAVAWFSRKLFKAVILNRDGQWQFQVVWHGAYVAVKIICNVII